MWSDAGEDPARCSGSGASAAPAAPLADGYPGGRALCEICLRFVPLDDAGRVLEHDTSDPEEADADARRRREWFNVHGW